jgi:hypothetical protein
MANKPARDLERDQFRAAIVGSNDEARLQFASRFTPGIDNFVSVAYKAYVRIQGMESRVPYELRSAWVYHFLFEALNNLITAFHLQISGLAVPAGNLMRQYAECVAMALLCSHRQINTFEQLQQQQEAFPVHKALDFVSRKRNLQLLSIEPGAWARVIEINAFYSKLSHPTVVATAATQIFAQPGMRALAGSFDEAKLDFYEHEMKLSLSGAMRLMEAVEHTVRILNERGGESDGI